MVVGGRKQREKKEKKERWVQDRSLGSTAVALALKVSRIKKSGKNEKEK